MKPYVILSLLSLGLGISGPTLLADGAKSRTKAQALVEKVIAEYPSVMIFGIHGVAPGSKDSVMIASNKGAVGKKDDDDDLKAFQTNTPVLEPVPTTHRYEVLEPMRATSGKPIGTLAVVFPWNGEDVKQYSETAVKIQTELQQEIASLDDLFTPAPATGPLLVAGPTVTIPNCKGKFDFLEVDTLNHRLLAPHEKDATMDFVDLDSYQLLARAPTGPAVDAVLAKNGKYFISDSDEKKVSVIDSDTFKIIGEIPTDGELDGMVYDTKNGLVYVTNDEGTHVWGINPDTQKVVADIVVPGVPEYMIYDPEADRIYLNIKDKDEVSVIDPNAAKVIALWPTGPASKPHGLAFDPVSKRLFAAGDNGKLSAIDATSGKLVGSADIAPGADQATYDPALRRIYAATGNLLSVVQENDNGLEFLGNVEVGSPTAKDVTIDTVTRTVWTAYTDGTNAYIKSWHLPR